MNIDDHFAFIALGKSLTSFPLIFQYKTTNPRGQNNTNAITIVAIFNPDQFLAVGMAYIEFGIDKPAFFRAMWNKETVYTNDESYIAATQQLANHLQAGFAETIEDNDPKSFSPHELLAWSSVHGLASLFVDGPVGKNETKQHKMKMANEMMQALAPALKTID